jgi:AbrB family looped-hinge helix DNA binding protein
MKTATNAKQKEAYLAKVGTSRQLAIPKKVYDDLELKAGDYIEIVKKDSHLLLTPKSLVDKGIAEGLNDIREGRIVGPFDNTADLIKSLDS